MNNELKNLMVSLISNNDIGSIESFSIFLLNNEASIDQIVVASSGNSWVYFEEHTFDGWYCISRNTDQTEFDVYYQERGQVNWENFKVSGRAEAVAMVMAHSGYLSF